MPFTLNAYRGHGHETLCFRTGEDAARFQEFVRTFMFESGSGSASGLYWLFDQQVVRVEVQPKKSAAKLDDPALQKMMCAVLVARTCADPPSVAAAIRHGTLDGAIVFRTEELPPRQRPTVGDLCRVFAPHPVATNEERKLGDARVIADNGATLTVVRHLDAEPDGTAKDGARCHTVRTAVVMKIDDWVDRLGIY